MLVALKVQNSLSFLFLLFCQVDLFLNLVRTVERRPRFFNCTLVAGEDKKPKAEGVAA